ncbi:hypothetical protein I6I97_12350 [Sphingobacterium multivorum]|uniref:hypothetical protein n=1 Tax=Sphingobacterium multivorum TaxID=28454 RepID=UPI001917F660|nr:hypothetical protein [Sphingobacterium multivorum]QQT60058.1 hypothetical protein I6I97_12350 [Sphingobacterium multivorum]
MAVKFINYHCDACENGIVMVKKRENGRRIDFSFQDCNVCKKAFGLKRVEGLKLVKNEIKEA